MLSVILNKYDRLNIQKHKPIDFVFLCTSALVLGIITLRNVMFQIEHNNNPCFYALKQIFIVYKKIKKFSYY
jgi:hypothetical protein